jgi:hypothetical protein
MYSQPGELRSEEQRRQGAYHRNKAGQMVDNIKAALLGTAATQVRSFLSDSIPSFREQYSEAERYSEAEQKNVQ